ncbi:DNA helicase RecQ [Anaeromicropila herbilytica]|uniref:DNA helicase RecQ n=1 Tax=Anaeromicropila herbilytica TaxID=2785025 RepID=A0A7R7EPN0_9FIRM|nr:DNA helicase RecQ [Anaeromicropila herbilytica]BCN32770.1 ATP-dependent DNA helicase RecQ [Anaeromicropila herbilytica]
MTKLYEALKKYFGYDNFRENQEDIILHILEGTDVLGIMPTGAGKSLCYQLPAILSKGITLVVSPLISLMKDQVDYLNSVGIESAYLNSSLSGAEYSFIIQGIYQKRYKMIYVAPERLENESFLKTINEMNIEISNVVIDEAHCVSRWGHDFRPSYTRIMQFINQLHIRPTVAAFTATATTNVKEDIVHSLDLKSPEVYITSFDRKNLEFKVFVNENKEQYIRNYITNHVDESGIIYAATRKDAEKLNQYLSGHNINVSIYHAGLSDADRMRAQEDFIYDNVQVMIATNAFGMGIDKSNVRYVIHYNMPRDLEAYYQEAGRAGRDGENSVCILLYSAADTAIQKYFIDESDVSEELKSHEYKKLQLMESYCHTSTCLRRYILEYFGDYSLTEPCGNCSVCNTEVEEKDVTIQAQMILSCIHRSGQRFGRSIIVDTLRGSRNQKVLKFNLNELKTYGLMKDYPKDDLDLLMNRLIADGYIYKTEEQYPILKLTNLSIPLLKNETSLTIQVAKQEKKVHADNSLLNKLKEIRSQIAKKEGYPPYVIFHDSTLIEMSIQKPKTLDELGEIKGVGENKRIKYGRIFLDVLLEYENPEKKEEKNVEAQEEIKVKSNSNYKMDDIQNGFNEARIVPRDNSDVDEICNDNNSGNVEEVFHKYYHLYKEDNTIEEIASILGVKDSTVEKNLLKAYESGEAILIDDFIQKEYETEIINIILLDEWDGRLRYIKDHVDEKVTYRTIKAVIIKLKTKINKFEL